MKHKTTYIHNKKVFFNYEIQETFEAGIELFGFEVKSIKNLHGTLDGSYITVSHGEAQLLNMNIPPYQVKNTPKEYNPMRPRKLLLHKKEIHTLAEIHKAGGKGNGGLTLVPISLYNNAGKIKVELCIAKGKKKADKRETIKKRETDREIRREFKR